MTTIFITGDRSVDPLSAVGATVQVVSQLVSEANEAGTELKFLTGSIPTGIERAVRYLLDADEVPHVNTAEGYIDFDERHDRVAQVADKVVFLHGDPLNSRIGASLVGHIPANKLVFV